MENVDSYLIKDILGGGVRLINSGHVTDDEKELIKLHQENKITALISITKSNLQLYGLDKIASIIQLSLLKGRITKCNVLMTEFKNEVLFWVDVKLFDNDKKIFSKILRNLLASNI